MGLFSTIFLRKKAAASPAPAQELRSDDEESRYRPIEWPLIRRLGRELLPYRGYYLLGIGLGLVLLILDMLSPYFMGRLINYVTGYTQTPEAARPTAGQAMRVAGGIIGIWALSVGAVRVLERFLILLMSTAGELVQFDLRRQLFVKLQQLSMDYYDKTKLGRIISRCTSDISSLREVNVWGIWLVLSSLVMITLAAVMLAVTDWRLFLAVGWLGPVVYVGNRLFTRKIAVRWQVVREGYARVATNLAENITGVRVVTAFNRQDANIANFNVMQERNTDNNVRAASLNGMYQPFLQIVGFTGKAIILTFGGYLFVMGRITPEKGVGSIVAAYLYWNWFIDPIVNLGNFSNQLMQAMAGAERIFSLLDMQPSVCDVPGARPLPRIAGRVAFENVTFGYKPDRPVLFDINFEARPGQTVALVGHTGSGKSSIISLIARFYQPQQGRVLIDGHDVRYVTGESLHKQTGLVLQVNYLFSGTVMENIRYAKPEADDREVMEAARAIGSHQAIMQLQDGYQTQVGERGANMSLGQRQLICFTRAFLSDPRILMLDEATSSVDTATEQIVQHSLEKLLANRTTFIVAHRLSTIVRADCILVVDQGRIVERGTHRELLRLRGKYAQLYRQFSKAAR